MVGSGQMARLNPGLACIFTIAICLLQLIFVINYDIINLVIDASFDKLGLLSPTMTIIIIIVWGKVSD